MMLTDIKEYKMVNDNVLVYVQVKEKVKEKDMFTQSIQTIKRIINCTK